MLWYLVSRSIQCAERVGSQSELTRGVPKSLPQNSATLWHCRRINLNPRAAGAYRRSPGVSLGKQGKCICRKGHRHRAPECIHIASASTSVPVTYARPPRFLCPHPSVLWECRARGARGQDRPALGREARAGRGGALQTGHRVTVWHAVHVVHAARKGVPYVANESCALVGGISHIYRRGLPNAIVAGQVLELRLKEIVVVVLRDLLHTEGRWGFGQGATCRQSS